MSIVQPTSKPKITKAVPGNITAANQTFSEMERSQQTAHAIAKLLRNSLAGSILSNCVLEEQSSTIRHVKNEAFKNIPAQASHLRDAI